MRTLYACLFFVDVSEVAVDVCFETAPPSTEYARRLCLRLWRGHTYTPEDEVKATMTRKHIATE